MRRLISLVSVLVALVGLGFVLVNATTVDRRPPSVKSVTLSAPANDPQVAQTVTAIDIEFSEPVRHATAEARFRILPMVDGSFTWNGSTAIFTPAHKLPLDASFTVSIDPGVEDIVGNADPVGLPGWTFSTVGPPVVLRTTPPDGAGGVPLDGTLELVFDRLMDTASVEAAISLSPPAPVTASWSGSIVTLTLGPGAAPGTTYQLTVGDSAADTGGSRLVAPFRMSFTTAGAGLNIVAVVPANGVAGIGVATPIAIRFDRPIDPATVSAAIHVTPNVDGSIRVVSLGGDGTGLGTVGPAGPGDTAVLVPSTPLAPHTTYTVTVDPTIAGIGDPGAVTLGQTWSFTTGAPTPSGQNQIAFLGARGGVRNVWVMNPDGTNQRELTVELLPVSSFDATADGGRIVYAAGGVVWLMNIDGSGAHRLTASDGRLEYAPVLVPGDSRVILARRDRNGADLGYWLVPLPGAPGSEQQILDHGAPDPGSASLGGDGIGPADGTSPWTPRIAFDPTGQVALIVTANEATQLVDLGDPILGTVGSSQLVTLSPANVAPTWVPQRNAFVLAPLAGTGGTQDLVSIDMQGHVSQIDGTSGASGTADVAADGSLVFAVRSAGRSRIRILAPSGTWRDLIGLTGGDDRWPTFAPNGTSILIGRTLASQPTSSYGIWSIDLPTGQARRLTVDGAFARWLP